MYILFPVCLSYFKIASSIASMVSGDTVSFVNRTGGRRVSDADAHCDAVADAGSENGLQRILASEGRDASDHGHRCSS